MKVCPMAANQLASVYQHFKAEVEASRPARVRRDLRPQFGSFGERESPYAIPRHVPSDPTQCRLTRIPCESAESREIQSSWEEESSLTLPARTEKVRVQSHRDSAGCDLAWVCSRLRYALGFRLPKFTLSQFALVS